MSKAIKYWIINEKLESYLRVIRFLLNAAFRCSDAMHSEKQGAIILFDIHDRNRGFKLNNKHFAQLLDPIALIAARHLVKSAIIARSGSWILGRRAFNPAICHDKKRLSILIKNFIHFNSFLSLNSFYTSIADTFLRSSIEYYDFIISVYSPIVIVSTQPEKALCIAAANRGIDTIDIQHGLIGETSRYYSKKRYELPTHYWVWNNNAKSILENYGINSSNIIVVGNIWTTFQSIIRFGFLDKNKITLPVINGDDSDKVAAARPSDAHLRLFSRQDIDRTQILYSLQNGIKFLPVSVLRQIISKVASIYPDRDIYLTLRLHPVQQLWLRERMRINFYILFCLFSGVRVTISKPFDCSPLEDLAKTCVHLTRHSAFIADAAYSGVPSLFYADPSEITKFFASNVADDKGSQSLQDIAIHLTEFIENPMELLNIPIVNNKFKRNFYTEMMHSVEVVDKILAAKLNGYLTDSV